MHESGSQLLKNVHQPGRFGGATRRLVVEQPAGSPAGHPRRRQAEERYLIK